MKKLQKHHPYCLFLEKQSNDLMIFTGKKSFNVIFAGAITLLFWFVFFVLLPNFPQSTPNRELLEYGLITFCLLSTLMFAKIVTTTEILTIRKPTQTATYEYRSFGILYGWKRHLEDFIKIKATTTMQDSNGGVYVAQDSTWVFELITKNGSTITVFPSLVHIPAKNREKALDFAQKISDFMGIEHDVAS